MADRCDATLTQPGRSRLLHGIALATAFAIFPLILAGAGVTSTDAGMADPDSPTPGDYLVKPPETSQQSDTRWERGHRIGGWIVGMLAIALAVLSWKKDGAIRFAACGTFAAIVLQGLLGGLRVTEVSRALAVVHDIWGQICFCLAALCVLLTSPGWTNWQSTGGSRRAVALRRLVVAACACLLLQLGLGATLRHVGGNHALIAHVVVAIVVMLFVGMLGGWVMSEHAKQPVMAFLGRALSLLLLAQLLLGGGALAVTVMGIGTSTVARSVVPSAHAGVGALLLACCLLLTAAVYRLVQSDASQKEPLPSPIPASSA